MESSSFKWCQGGSRPTVPQSLLMVLRSQICTAELCLQAERSEAEAQLRFGGTMAPTAAAGAWWGEPGSTCRGLGGEWGGVICLSDDKCLTASCAVWKRSRQMNLLPSFLQTGRSEGGKGRLFDLQSGEGGGAAGKVARLWPAFSGSFLLTGWWAAISPPHSDRSTLGQWLVSYSWGVVSLLST